MTDYLDALIKQMGWECDDEFCDWLGWIVDRGCNITSMSPADLRTQFEGQR